MKDSNPFRIHGTVSGRYFADREKEVKRIGDTLAEGGSKLLVYGPRRMGKTSAIREAIRAIDQTGGHAFLADLSTASTVADMANRILDGAVRALGRKWREIASELVERMGAALTLSPDPVTGLILPSLEVGLRRATIEEQQLTLGRALDALDQMAAARETILGIALDEFQEIHRFGGEQAEWHLRGSIQNHDHLGYVLAGSEEHLIHRMLGKKRAFYGLFDVMEFGPMDADVLGTWIDARTKKNQLKPNGVGSRCVVGAGPRTRDVVQLARKVFDVARPRGEVLAGDLERAFREIVEEEEDLARTLWENLTSNQQNVLRAVAGADAGLTTRDTIERFSLGDSGTAANTAKALIGDGLLVKSEAIPGYVFDSPFFRGWVILKALPDLGIHRDPIPPEAVVDST